jgi:S-layer family protein
MKKVLSLVLVIAMVLSSMSFAFGASAFEDVADTDYAKAIDTLVALGVVTGYEDGTFRPEKTVTRAEMAKLIVELLGYGDLVAGSKSNFADTQGHWADAWIALAAGKGLVVGTGDGKFTPDRTVSYDEAITMVVRALGYTDNSNELKNMTWPTNFKVKAAELKLTKDVALVATGADRGGVAQLMYNALSAALVTVNSDGDVVKTTTTYENASGNIVTQYVELLSRLATLNNAFVVNTDHLDKDDKDYAGNMVDLTPYMYQSLRVYLNDDDEVVFIKENNSSILTGTVIGVNESNKTIKVEDADGKEYTINTDGEIITFYNGEQSVIDASDFDEMLYRDNNSNKNAKITVIGNSDKKIVSGDTADKFVVEKATKGILVSSDYATGKSKINGEIGSIVLPEDSDGDLDLDAITVTGAVEELDEISKGDVVVAYESLESPIVKLVVVRDTVEGTVTKTSSDATTIYVDGTKYSLSRVENAVRYEDPISVGDEGIFYLDNAGSVFAVDTDGEDLSDYAWVIGTALGEYGTDFNGSVEKYAQIKLLTDEGDTVTYKVLASIEKDGAAYKLDDCATFNDEYDATVNDDNLLVIQGADKLAFATEFTDNITAGNKLVRYALDKNGYIEELELVETETERIDLDEIDDITSDDVVVFNFDDEEVVSVNVLKDNESHEVVYKSGKIVVIVTDKVDSADDIYGTIKAVNYVKNSKGDKVVEFVAFVNGEEVTYLSDKNVTISGLVTDTTTAAAYKFVFDGDEVTDIDPINNGGKTEVYSGTATSVSSTKITVNGTTKYFATNVAVYIYDESDDAITIGDVADLEEDCATSMYIIDNTESSRVGIVVQVQP